MSTDVRNVTIIVMALIAFSCEKDAGEGSVSFTTWGEEYIEVGIPDAAASSDAEGFVDGWSVTFDRFLIVLADPTVADHSDLVGGTFPGAQVFDMTLSGPHAVCAIDGLEARRWDDVGVTVLPADAASTAGNCTADDVAVMTAGGYSVYVEGSASSGTDSVTFSWGFNSTTIFSECTSDEFGDGVVIPDGGTQTVQFTIHGDHFFYDDLQSEDPSLRFGPIAAADADDDGDVTIAELEAVPLTSLPVDQYGTGGNGSIVNLGQFVEALTHTLVHYQGEGHCHAHVE